MMSVLSLAIRSLMNRRGSVLLTLLAIALSVALFLGVEKARMGARDGFSSTISSADLIVGAPTSEVNLLLYSVFRMGNATAEVNWPAYQKVAAREDVDWVVPISLGDSHKGYRVLGTTPDYLAHYQYGDDQPLEMTSGAWVGDLFDVVLGADVARALGYSLGEHVELSHGLGHDDFGHGHDDRHFEVSGILKPTGTPVDKTVHISLEAITALHVGWESGAKHPLADTITEEMIRDFDLTPRSVTAVFVGLRSPSMALGAQRAINTEMSEPLMAIIPGQALAQLWGVTEMAERALLAVSAFVIFVGLVSIMTNILAGLNERRREMSILRAVGAGPGHVFSLLVLEAGVIGFVGALLGIVLVYVALAVAGPMLAAQYGVSFGRPLPGWLDLGVLGVVTLASIIMGAVPAWMALRRSLADGLTVKL